MKIKKIECPCCENFTIDGGEEVIVDICEVCHWQYDIVMQNNPDILIGPNNVTLNQAKENYKEFGASEKRFEEKVRKPYSEELPRNNQ